MTLKVQFKNVTKKYSLYKKKSDKLREIFFSNKKNEDFYALNNISFEVYKGETIGIVGVNGSGKSTLSNLLAQVVPPTSGTIKIDGETSLIAISVGLNNHLTGMENIKLKCLMQGFTKNEINEITPKIIEFADIGKFIRQPVKNYSSGMKSRLGFAISAHTNPDILVVDEALSVGDQTFYQKCLQKFDEFKASGKTIFFISHSISQISSISDKVLWLHYGQLKEFGETKTVLENYQAFIKWFNALSEEEKKQYKVEMHQAQSFENQGTSNLSEAQQIKRTDKARKKKQYPFLFLFQIGFLLMGMFLSALFMFNETSSASILGKIPDLFAEKQAIKKEQVKIKKVDSKGIVKERTAVIYSDQALTNKALEVPFTTTLFVEEKANDVYKIKVNDSIGYTSVKNVELVDNSKDITVELTTEDLKTLFPLAVANSYQYFLAQLDLDYGEIGDKLRGLTNRGFDEFGNKILFYDTDHISILFNEDNVSEAITIHDIVLDEQLLEDIQSRAEVKSDDKSLYYISIQNYYVTINIKDRTLTFAKHD
ncbi:teichoic acids export ABC transporter ATP-binding subunit TagH [Peribacillus frigoritolerans]|uniref:teichoic acids export ABC transporter ATP-binding subunit TagH n=1 Tax=Peribacillus frigoritolerans TaxID=450367 RepID=UPI0022305E68|nr:teichoic acids export ABC transporter ATP-binding subunit TagH [Peribacillus frigoritolerans]MDM5313218.1 teichoic acids export ABC transporter ATP-binding subunit TagH [Peribacillus frigoritolerans]UZD45466.1 teichoic acids export ABC transporter ATP-binding subunit TagH [Peribacillus frigoritolerans]